MHRKFLVISNSCMPSILPNFRLIFCDLCSSKPQKTVSFRGFSTNPTRGIRTPPGPQFHRQNPNSAPTCAFPICIRPPLSFFTVRPWYRKSPLPRKRLLETLAQVFSCEFCEISRNTFSTEHLQTTASVASCSQLYAHAPK